MNLPKKINGVAVLFMKRSQDVAWSEIGRTEMSQASSEPAWVKSIIVAFCFEVQQKVRIEIYHTSRPDDKDLGAQEFVGSIETFLADLVTTGTSGALRPMVILSTIFQYCVLRCRKFEMCELKCT